MIMVEKVTVEEMYKYWSGLDEPMFTTYSAEFWDTYKQFYGYFDNLFYKTYRSFLIYTVRDHVDMHNAGVDWHVDIGAFLRMNQKRYEELYRLQEIGDIDYSLLNPYSVTETHSKTTSDNRTDNMGGKSETRSKSLSYGATSASDSGSTVHGAKSETDSKSMNYGQDKTTTTEELNVGTQVNSSENRVSAYNETVYQPKDLRSDSLGTRTDETNTVETRAARNDSESGTHTEASFTDTHSNTHTTQAKTDSESGNISHAAYTDTHSETGSENRTVTKKGNLGIYSFPKLLSEHEELWKAFNFYKMIFDEIAEQFLRIEY